MLTPLKIVVNGQSRYQCPECKKSMSRQAWVKTHPCNHGGRTPRHTDLKILSAIREYRKTHPQPPGVRDIALAASVSKNTVWRRLQVMREAGLVDFQDRLSRTVIIKEVIV